MLKIKRNQAVLLAIICDFFVVFACFHLRTLMKISAFLSPFCPFRQLTGLKCPSCGGTHALQDILNGDYLAAIHDNFFILSLGSYLLVLLILFNLWSFSLKHEVKKLLLHFIHYKVVIGIGIFAGIFSVYRNIMV